MSLLRKLLAVFAVVGLMGLAGCPEKPKDAKDAAAKDKGAAKDAAKDAAKEPAKDAAKDGAKEPAKDGAKEPAKAEVKSNPVPAEKLSKALPAGVQAPVEVKMPKSAWTTGSWGTAKVGDWAEYETDAGGTKIKTKSEVFDVGSDGLVVLNTMNVAGNDIKSAIKYVFTEADPAPVDTKGEKPEVKTSDDKVKVGDKEIAAKVTEVSVMGKPSKTWTSTEVPLDGSVKSEVDGKVVRQLVGFGHGK